MASRPATTKIAQATNGFDVLAGHSVVATTWGTAPTVPPSPMRRAVLQSVIGAGLIWVWNPGEFVIPFAAQLAIETIVPWQYGSVAVTYDCYFKIAE